MFCPACRAPQEIVPPPPPGMPWVCSACGATFVIADAPEVRPQAAETVIDGTREPTAPPPFAPPPSIDPSNPPASVIPAPPAADTDSGPSQTNAETSEPAPPAAGSVDLLQQPLSLGGLTLPLPPVQETAYILKKRRSAPVAEQPAVAVKPAVDARPFRRVWLLGMLACLAGVAGGLTLVFPLSRTEPLEDARAVPAVEPPPQPLPASPLLQTDPPRALPARLLGLWESRSDDGSTSTIEFSPEGRAEIHLADGQGARPTRQTRWFVHSETPEGQFVIDLGREYGGFGNNRLVLTLTSPESFTLTEAIFLGVSLRSEIRFVRTADAGRLP